MTNYPIPPILRERPVDHRGYVIPFFVPIVNGVPDFRYQDANKRRICIDQHVCSICGKKLYLKSYWFACGPMGLMNTISSDAAMHEDCARYSLAVCPHMLLYRAERRTKEVEGNPNLLRQKPDNIFLVKANKFWLISDGKHQYIKFRPVSNEQYHYVENKLVLKVV